MAWLFTKIRVPGMDEGPPAVQVDLQRGCASAAGAVASARISTRVGKISANMRRPLWPLNQDDIVYHCGSVATVGRKRNSRAEIEGEAIVV